MWFAASLLLVGFALLVAGVALVSTPAALCVAGAGAVLLALFVDFDELKVRGGRRG